MEAFVIFTILYFLIIGLTQLGLVMTGHLPIKKDEYRPNSPKHYYILAFIMIGIALWGAFIL